MNFYELIDEIVVLRQECHWDNLPHSFNLSSRAKLKEPFDLEVFDIVEKAYRIEIIYRSDCRDVDEKKNIGNMEIRS